jgi:histone-lysine N-methyltransferase SETD2
MCKNQRFQKCKYAQTKLFKTEGRGWGLLADENIKAGQFIIEYCGEVITSNEAERRSRTYEAQGLMDAYIISLNANNYIDATRKGSVARFINHSCQPNCQTRKWTVLGETRVGIFAKQDICTGTELAYDYNFEWYGGINVRCLCGAPNCSIFLGAKSQGFQEHNHVWVDGDDRYTVTEIPIYDSAEDDDSPWSKLLETTTSPKLEFSAIGDNNGFSMMNDSDVGAKHPVDSTNLITEPVKTLAVVPESLAQQDTQLGSPLTNSPPDENGVFGNFDMGPPLKKRSGQNGSIRRSKQPGQKRVSGKHAARLFASKEAREDILKYEEIRDEADAKLEALYDEIRPAIEERERDSQDSVPTVLGEKWIEAACFQMKADFDLNFSIIQNVLCPKPSSSNAGDTNM